MNEDQTTQARPLEEASRKELNNIADNLGVSKAGTNVELIARIRAVNTTPDVDGDDSDSTDDEVTQSRPTTKVVRKTGQQVFFDTMQEINTVLANYPGVLDVIRVKKSIVIGDSEALRDGYSWAEKSAESRKIRSKVRAGLKNAWQAGALNYEMISKRLRLPDISVKALLDEEFIAANGL